jgi:putative ABC transport system permease protein
MYLFSLTESTKGTITNNLQSKWESTYDLLVTPKNSIFNDENLMEPNFLTGINGGISYQQYEEIKEIQDIEVAAPISVLGYTQLMVHFKNTFDVTDPGIYRIVSKTNHDNGLFNQVVNEEVYYDTVGWLGHIADLDFGASDYQGFILRQNQLMVGIDPVEEAKLVGLDEAMDSGHYFNNMETVKKDKELNIIEGVPIIINKNSFADSVYTVEMQKLDIPFETPTQQSESAEKIRKQGKSDYLHKQKGETIGKFEITGKELQELYFQHIKQPNEESDITAVEGGQVYLQSSTIDYLPIQSPYPNRWSKAFQVENKLIEISEDDKVILSTFPSHGYRQISLLNHEMSEFGVPLFPVLHFNILGTYDIGKLNINKDPLTKLPLQTYRPAEAEIVLDSNSKPLNPVLTIHGSGSPIGLLTNPPNILTTVRVAEEITGGNSISSIRIKVKGIDQIGEASQQKLTDIKEEIEEKTGLQVTITRGSSPQPTITKIVDKGETLGWMEQTWIHLGSAITILRETSLGYTSILLAVLIIGSMYVFATTYVSFLTNKRDYSIFLALGWKKRMIRRLIVAEALSYVIVISLISIGVEYILSRNGYEFNWEKIGLVTVTCLVIYGVGILVPIIHVGTIKPYQGIKTGEIRNRTIRILQSKHLVGLVFNQIMQRPGRNLLSILAIALPSTLLSFYLFVSFRLDGILYTSYLGEFVAVEVNNSHYLIMGAALFVGILTTAQMMWQNIVERKNDLALFKAIGWKNSIVAISILLEGAVIGFLAGLIGLLLSMGYIGFMYDIFPWDSLTILSLTICVPTLIGMIGAIIPTIQALRTSPYEVLKESA